jgi:hypothetical protein
MFWGDARWEVSMIDDVKRRSRQLGLVLPAGLKPEVAEHILDQAEAEERQRPKPTLDEAIAAQMERSARDEETRRMARRIFEEDRQFFELLGDR